MTSILGDPYSYLHNQDDPETLKFLTAENQRTDSFMQPLRHLQDELYAEMCARILETDQSVPWRFGSFDYYSRTEHGRQHAILCRRRVGGNREQILLDCNQLAEGKAFFALGFNRPSPDGNLLAFAVDTSGNEIYSLRFKDLRTGSLLLEQIPSVYTSFAWAADSENCFYTVLDDTNRPYQIWRHAIGRSASDDSLVYEEMDERFDVSLERSRSGKFIFATVKSRSTSEVHYCDSMHPERPFRVVAPRVEGVQYYLDHQNDAFYLRTNDEANNFRLMKAPVTDPTRESWVEVLPNREGVVLESVTAFRDYLVLVERERGSRQLQVRGRTDIHVVRFDEPVYTLRLGSNEDYAASTLRFTYSSLVTPPKVYDYHMKRRKLVLRKRDRVKGYDAGQYVTERIFADTVPISLVYRRGLGLDGTNPLLLYGYGSYGVVTEPMFSVDRVSLLSRGFVFAIAHVRGSADLGRDWYDDGKLLKKKNTFNDFIACAEHLVAEKYTSTDKLAICGESAGGLLVGVAVNMRPDLFKVAVAQVPFVDVVSAMLDPTLPLTVQEYEEWGNPADPAVYEYIKSYSPYENVTQQNYPSMLVTAALNDVRVPYWGPVKWVAKLRDLKTDLNVLLLKTNLSAGHAGSSGRYSQLSERAFKYAFILSEISMSTGKERT